MEFTSLMLPLTKNICRTCLMESDTSMFMNIQDLIEHEMSKVKLIDILVYLNCLESNDEENWPQGMCSTCVSTALVAYNFKLNSLKANNILSQIITLQSSDTMRSDIDSIDINVVYQDHEYEVPLLYHSSLDLDSNTPKEVTPLPPVTEITSGEQPPRQEGEKKYACNICGKQFTRLYGHRYHMSKHTNFRKYLCTKCGKGFFTPNGLKQHSRSHQDTAQFKCGFCNKTYKSRQSLKEHFRIAHSSNRRLFVCITCGKRYTTSSAMRAHMRTHTGEKSFPCPHCPKSYTRPAYLRAHSLVHTGEERVKPFKCNYIGCDRSFTTKHSLLVHIAHTHTTERPHKCDICDKGFATAHGLKVHRETHGSQELSCNICGKKFTNKRVLQKHVKTHDVDANDMILETVDNVFFDQVY